MGVFLEYDTIARYKYHSDEDELMLIGEMVKQDFGEQVLLGLDTTRERMKAYGGSIGLDYIAARFLPMLAGAGIGENHAEDFMVNNPRKALRFIQKGIEQ
jgi:phosphotriesterase-related protein